MFAYVCEEEKMKEMHIFTVSGLGEAPFYLHNPISEEITQVSGVFYCEHCGTVLKNRHFIKSSDGKVSVVGIDCLNKTGDSGLISAVKAEKLKLREEKRHAKINGKIVVKHQKEIEKYGKTINEIIDEILLSIAMIKEETKELIEDHMIIEELSKSNFGSSMIEKIINGESLSDSMINIIKEIITKKISQSKKGSKKYKESTAQAEKIVEDFMNSINIQTDKIKILQQKRLRILNTKI